jgi:hypothetical protein
MGGKSSSKSSQKSDQKSFSQALYGDNSGVNIGGDGNNVNFTDHGAIEGALQFARDNSSNAFSAVMDSNANMGSVAESGLALADSTADGAFDLVDGITGTVAGLADNLGFGAFDLASDMAGTNAELASQSMMNSSALASEGFSLANSLSSDFIGAGAEMFGAGAELINQSGERNLDAALSIHNTGLQQLELGTEFVTNLNQQSLDNNLQAQRDNNAALSNGFKSSMQFVEGFSRSDGNAVAEVNMKTVGLLSLAAVGVAFAVRKGK